MYTVLVHVFYFFSINALLILLLNLDYEHQGKDSWDF